jgi:hypothetical protein
MRQFIRQVDLHGRHRVFLGFCGSLPGLPAICLV